MGASSREVAVLGGEDFIYSQQSGISEDLFKNGSIGLNADIASVDFRQTEFRTLSSIPDIAPPQRFLDRVALHFARNLLLDAGAITGRAPLVCVGKGRSFSLHAPPPPPKASTAHCASPLPTCG